MTTYERVDLHREDLRDVTQYGAYLDEPSNQLVRLVAMFHPEQRVSFLKSAHKHIYGHYPGSSLERFIGDFFITALKGAPAPYLWGEFEQDSALFDLHDRRRSPRRHPLVCKAVAAALSGESPRFVAAVLTKALLFDDLSRNEDLLHLLGESLNGKVLMPEQAAALVSAIEYNAADVLRFENTAEYIVDETFLLPDNVFTSDAERRALYREAGDLRLALQFGREYRVAAGDLQRDLVQVEDLCHAHHLAQSVTGIFVPLGRHLLVAKSIADARAMATRDRELLLSMTPREFEEFMSNVFRELGFHVEMTKATRDGGTDLICMRSLHGIPFRIAIEVKRYRDKPVDVQMVRSFVGSNQQWQANRLLYVTTSRYTQPAMSFANDYAQHILTLRDYDQIAEWCDVIRGEQPSLL